MSNGCFCCIRNWLKWTFALLRFTQQTILFTKYLRYTFSVYAILTLGLGAMFTRAYRLHDFTANTVYCGKILKERGGWVFNNQTCLFTLIFLIFRVSYACDDHHESDPSDRLMFAHGEGKQTSWNGALPGLWGLCNSVPTRGEQAKTSKLISAQEFSAKSLFVWWKTHWKKSTWVSKYGNLCVTIYPLMLKVIICKCTLYINHQKGAADGHFTLSKWHVKERPAGPEGGAVVQGKYNISICWYGKSF